MHQEMSLFVFGAMSDGLVHYKQIEPYVVRSESATIKALAYRLQVGYPVLTDVNSLEADNISGQLVTLQAPDLFFRVLDEFHGFSPLTPEKSLFLKTQATVHTATDQYVTCFVYSMNPAKLPKTAQRIANGDWRHALKTQPPLTQLLTEKQATYIRRLSQVSGREIVPIDLQLYRELIKLELVADKGRRLALTKLGQEVARYLE